MDYSIFELTSNGKRALCYTEKFGSFYELMKLLGEVRHAKQQTPTLDEVDWMQPYFNVEHGVRLLCTRDDMKLFQHMEPTDFYHQKEMIRQGDKNCRHVVLDYDADVFSSTEWSSDGLETMEGSLNNLLQAYSNSLRKKNATQMYLKTDLFEKSVQQICTIYPASWADENQEIITEAAKSSLSPEREQELLGRLVDYVSEYFGDSELYDILHNTLEMSHEDMEGLGFCLQDQYETPTMEQKM